MTLLKVLYFAHAWYLAKEDKPLIAQPFEAWDYGPVNRVVYDQFKKFGKNPINIRAVSFDVSRISFCPTSYSLDAETEKFLGDIFDYYSQFHALKLSDLTHEKGGPWDVIWSAAATCESAWRTFGAIRAQCSEGSTDSWRVSRSQG